PLVRCFSGRSELFVRDGRKWRRMSCEDEAHGFTGFNRETREPNVGIYIESRPNGLVRVGFDLWKLDANLRPAVIERIESRWRQEADRLSKPLLRHAARRAHFSKSFMRFEISSERIDEWNLELESFLSDPDSYESDRKDSSSR